MRFSFLATLAFLALGQAGVYKGINDAWSFDVYVGDNDDWMSTIADSTPMSSLVIPGTHDSATESLTNKMRQTQNVPLEQQLAGGIRYIDITCKQRDSYLMVYNGLTETEYSFKSVLRTIFNFLDAHDREAVILRVQMRGAFTSSRNLVKSFESHFAPDTIIGHRAAGRLYTKGEDGITTIPTLGELRGKLLILEDFKTSTPGRYGLPWNKDTISNYHRIFSAGTLSMSSKWNEIQSHLSEAPLDSPAKLRITHTTASVGVSPIDFAARNAPHSGMNKRLGQYLENRENRCFGIVVMDFPGRFNVEQILKRNDRYRIPEPSPNPFHHDTAFPEPFPNPFHHDTTFTSRLAAAAA